MIEKHPNLLAVFYPKLLTAYNMTTSPKIQRWSLKEFEKSADKIKYISLIGGTQNNPIDWEAISKHQYLSEWFIEEYQDSLDRKLISQYQILSESFLAEHIHKVHWVTAVCYQTLSETFIAGFVKENLDEYCWNLAFRHQKLSETFLDFAIIKIDH